MTLAAGWIRLRTRLLSSVRFQSLAMRFPLTRRKARREIRDTFDLCAGFVYSQVLYACVQLNIFEALREDGLSVGQLAHRAELPVASMAGLLQAASALKLVSPAVGSNGEAIYLLGERGAILLGNPGVLALVRHHQRLYADLLDPVARLRSGRDDSVADAGQLQAYWSYAKSDRPDQLRGDRVGEYSALMAASQQLIASQVLAAYPFRRHSKLLDVGGGSGAFVTEVANAFPQLSLSLFDLPAVAALADERLAAAGLGKRVAIHQGDFFRDALPSGADLITLVRILHDHDDDRVLELLQRVYEALIPGGVVLVAEPMAEPDQSSMIADAYFSMYLIAMGSGRPRSQFELTGLLRRVGFKPMRSPQSRAPELVSLVCAQKPGRDDYKK